MSRIHHGFMKRRMHLCEMLSLRIISIMAVFIVANIVVEITGFTYMNAKHSSSELGEDCLTPSGTRGMCQKISDCKLLLGFLIENKSKRNSRVINFLLRSHCGFVGIHPVVCCPILDNSVTTQRYIDRRSPSTQTHFETECGFIRTTNRIIGGSTASLSEFPWMALIGYQRSTDEPELEYLCGGSLISSRYVLTAAHCVSDLRHRAPKTVRLGEYDLSTKEDCTSASVCAPPAVDIAIEKVIPHPDYYRPEIRNDIALIKLAENVKFGDFIRPICLPKNSRFSNRSFSKAVVTGWGLTENDINSAVLLKIKLPIVSPAECFRAYKHEVAITDRHICAGGEAGKDSCKGDSGGPLQVIGTNDLEEPAYIQEGIVSFGSKKCGTDGKPGVYTRVSRYVNWILMNLNE